jgi:mono/diheme cytochrome c family protein
MDAKSSDGRAALPLPACHQGGYARRSFAGAIAASLWAYIASAGPQTPLVGASKGDALAASIDAASREGPATGKFYRIVDGKVDAGTYNGFRRYHASCNHCHGPDGTGSTFAPSLVGRLSGIDAFRHVVNNGRVNGTSVMKGFGDDPNIAPYIDDIYAYLQARADGVLGPGRPLRLEN